MHGPSTLETNIQTSFSIKLLHLQFSSMTCHQGLRIRKLGQVENPRWPPLLKIAKITKSTFLQNHWIFLAEFGMEYQWNIGIQNCKNEKICSVVLSSDLLLFTSVTLPYLKIAYLNKFKQLFFLKPLRQLLSNFT